VREPGWREAMRVGAVTLVLGWAIGEALLWVVP
jgi:hypothetical protein